MSISNEQFDEPFARFLNHIPSDATVTPCHRPDQKAIIVTCTNAYDAQSVWEQRKIIPLVEVTVMIGAALYDSTRRYSS